MSKQPEALRLANALERGELYESHSSPVYGWCGADPCSDAAAELRRQHALIAELVEALERISVRCPTNHGVYNVASVGDMARATLSKAKEQP